jgi:hypothetical protein
VTTDQDAAAIRETAGRLFDEKFRTAGWTGADFDSYAGWSIRQAVIAIAAGGEPAAVQQILSAYVTVGAIPQLRADGTVFHPLLDRCMAVIRESRAGGKPAP